MAELVSWNTCFYYVASKHLEASQASTLLVFLAFLCLLSYFLLKEAYTRTALKEKYSEEQVSKVLNLLVTLSAYFTLAFLVYYTFFFKPDAVQLQVTNMEAGIMNPQYFIQQMV